MQFWSAPLSIRAIALIEKSSTTKLTMEYHFWKVILDMVYKNWVCGISVSGITEDWKSGGGGRSALRDSIIAIFASISRSFDLRERTSVLRKRTCPLSSLISVCSCFIVTG